MSLINREDLIKRLPEVDLDHDEMITKSGAVADMIVLISSVPEVDAEPVVHGHWCLTDNGKLICSKCKIPSAMSRQFVGAQYKSRYCPNCGAKMDGKDGEQE